MPVNPGLAALFEGLSTFGQGLPVALGNAQKMEDAATERERADQDFERREAARKRFQDALTAMPQLGQALGVGSPELVAGGAVDLEGPGIPASGQQSFQQLLSGIGSRPVDPFALPQIAEAPAPDFANPLAPTAEELAALAGRPATPPAAAGPRRVSYSDQVEFLRSKITAPEDVQLFTPYINDLENAARAEAAGDKLKSDAYAAAAKAKLDTALTIFRENQATARNTADNTARAATQTPPAKAPGNMTLPELQAQVTGYKKAIADLKKQNFIMNKGQIDNLSKELAKIYGFYTALGGTDPLTDVPGGNGNAFNIPTNFFATPATPAAAPGQGASSSFRIKSVRPAGQ